MVRFQREEDISKWLKNRPFEISVTIASRAALRQLPILDYELSCYARYNLGVAELGSALILPTFRAVAISWAVAAYPHRISDISSHLPKAISSAGSAAAVHQPYPGADERAWVREGGHNLCPMSAYGAADTARSPISAHERAATTVRNTVLGDPYVAALNPIALANSAYWTAASLDAATIERGTTREQLILHPLWLGEPPSQLKPHWLHLKDQLLTESEDWSVWTDWYAARWSGNSSIEDVEFSRAAISDEIWNAGPRVLNRHIQDILDGRS